MESLLAAFMSKRADAWRGLEATDSLSSEAQRQLAERDALIRVLDSRSVSAPNMRLELAEYQRLRAADAQSGDPKRRVIFNLIMDEAYERQPEDTTADFNINTTNKPESAWLPTIFSEIGQLKARASISDSTGAMTTIVGVVVALALIGIIAMVYYDASHHLIPMLR